jgi:catechol 2,3-dioxygenase-like lactoylglutathione lyase family enzyme
MTTVRFWCLAIVMAVMADGWQVRGHGVDKGIGQGIDRDAPDSGAPALAHTCLISKDVKRLVGFYEPVLGLKAVWSGEDYAEFRTGGGVLAIFAAEAQEKYIPGSAEAGQNRSVILEFRVADVDREYRRLQSLVKVWVKPPTTQRWGTRSIYFRDPDGSLVDFFAPAGVQANP